MGIAVLPYEMHKEYFKHTSDEERSKENEGKLLAEIQQPIKNTIQYTNLKHYIKELYINKKWFSTYPNDLYNGCINEDKVVFSFLGHIRNVHAIPEIML